MTKVLILVISKITSIGQNKVYKVVKRFQTGTCGIPPFPPPEKEPPSPPPKFPDHLIRPACLPGQASARFPPDCEGMVGYYCPPQRVKYTYPPFSENIDFVPSGKAECWWATPKSCDFTVEDEDNIPIKL